MECTRCHAALPEVAHFCHRCGNDVRTDDATRRKSFAAKPDEPVASFALVSSIMPRAAISQPRTYRYALALAFVVAVVTAMLGALPLAVLVAAFAIPVVYIVYLYDVNLWEDEPVLVTALAFLATLVLGLGFTALWWRLRGPDTSGLTVGGSGFNLTGFLIAALLVPIVGELIRQVGPVLLASRPEFDDLMDGLAFGVISGVAYATADTLVKNWGLLTGGYAGLTADAGTWMALMALEGFVKPLVLGTATGIACAEFSGLGNGYDGFTPRYLKAVGQAILVSMLYFGGAYLFDLIPARPVALGLTILWGLALLAVLLLRVRSVLHHGLMEAGLEDAARAGGVGDGTLSICPACEMPLMPEAHFCTACGTSVRVAGHGHHEAVPAGAPPLAPDAQPSAPANEEGQA